LFDEKPIPKAIRGILKQIQNQNKRSGKNTKLEILAQAYKKAMKRIQG
jgi:hypothetical protein